MKRLNILVLLILLTFSSSIGQKKIFKGIVFAFDSIPVMNAEILISSSKQIVKCDSNGYFSFEGKVNEKIKISANGFAIKSQKLTGNSNPQKVNLRLKSSKKSLELAIQSGHFKDSKQFRQLVSNKNNPQAYSIYSSVIQAIRGKFPSVDIQNNGFVIRGKSSFIGTSYALIEVDGILVNINVLNTILPSNLKSIAILTASNSGLYGSRGANGVVVIKTKQGIIK